MVLYFKRMGEQNVTFMMAILYSKFFVLNCIYNRLASAVEYVDIRLQDAERTMTPDATPYNCPLTRPLFDSGTAKFQHQASGRPPRSGNPCNIKVAE